MSVNVRIAIGLMLGLLIGAACRLSGVPLPAPLALVGALLVVMMTSGYILTDRYLARRPSHTEDLCGGPAGTCKEEGKE